jgi:deoxyadenosine/deoxycytidine kinase
VAERFIAVSGNIGVGKSSLVRYLSQRYGVTPVYEPFDENPYLDDFYGDMPRWAFQSQVWFLSRKQRLHLQVQRDPGTFVMDRTIWEDAEIFAAYLARSKRMQPRDYATYLELYGAMRESLRPPDLLIHLRCSVRAIRRRIKQRGRTNEQAIPTPYLRSLNELYESWIGRWDESPLLVWDSEHLDVVEDMVHRLEFHREVERYLR